MIKGVTHNEDGSIREKLPIVGKVAIGEAPDDNRNYPVPLDHFKITKRREIGNDVKWVQDDELMEEFDSNMEPKEVPVILLSNSIEQNFRTSLQWWKADHLHCYGDGELAHRWDDEKEERFEMDCPCDKLEEGLCKPSGQLRFSILSEEAQIGGTYAFYTTSEQTIRQIYTNLKAIKNYTSTPQCPNGRLRGLPLRLKLNPGETKFNDQKGETRETIHYFPYLSFHPADLKDNDILNTLQDQLGKIDTIDSSVDEEAEEVEINDLEIDDDEEEIFGDFVNDN